MKKFFLFVLLFLFNQLLAMVNGNDELLKQLKITLQPIFTSYLLASNNYLIELEALCTKNNVRGANKKNKMILQTMKETNEYQKKFLHEYQKIYICAFSFQMLLEENSINSFHTDVSGLLEFMKNMQDPDKKSYDCQVYNSLLAFYTAAVSEKKSQKNVVKKSSNIDDRIKFFEQLSKKKVKVEAS